MSIRVDDENGVGAAILNSGGASSTVGEISFIDRVHGAAIDRFIGEGCENLGIDSITGAAQRPVVDDAVLHAGVRWASISANRVVIGGFKIGVIRFGVAATHNLVKVVL